MDTPTHYDILGVDVSASLTDIKSAFRRASAANHPDAVGSGDGYASSRFMAIKRAYDVLSTPDLRDTYDRQIGLKGPRRSPRAYDAAKEDLERLRAAGVEFERHMAAEHARRKRRRWFARP